ncbi:MAG TPA: putative zinc-binding metallopeptidase [Pyrinomonadaceae bacterium]|nr:putative zinc-binding metallopeptidase [Pyrinomonadaceae bacterium]
MRASFAWKQITDDELLDLRLCDLPVRIEGTPLQERVRRIRFELDESGLRFRPHVWLSVEWFTPDGVPGFAIPFYLAHPRLVRLERKQMLEVEGGTERECLRIMRHEAGHALDNAFLFRKRRRWRELFGSFREPYPSSYRPNPTSRDFVLHLGAWYAQAHPAEDFAETFAVWLATARGRWLRRYEGWGALAKLEYVDRLMQSVLGKSPGNRRRDEIEPLSRIRMTLREYYEQKRARYSFNWPATYDRDLRRIFSDERRFKSKPTAASFLRRAGRDIVQTVAAGTGVHQYTLSHLLSNMIDRCKLLRLRLTGAERQARQQALVMLTVQTMNVVHTGYHRIPL